MKDLLVKFNRDVVVLRKSKISVVGSKLVKFVWSSCYFGWAALEAYGSSSGILLMWKDNTIMVIDSIHGQFTISILCKTNASFSCWIIGVYGPLSYRLRD